MWRHHGTRSRRDLGFGHSIVGKPVKKIPKAWGKKISRILQGFWERKKGLIK